MRTGSAAPDDGSRAREDAQLGRQLLVTAGVVLVAAVYVLHAALPAVSFGLPFDNRQTVRTLVPEGWAFFTRSPRTPEPAAYGAGPDGTWRQLTGGSRSGPRDAFGLNRRARSQGTELGIVMSQVPKEHWSSCERAPTDCLSGVTPRLTVTNYSTHHTLCGDVGLALREVRPWAWRDLPGGMPAKVARVVVTC